MDSYLKVLLREHSKIDAKSLDGVDGYVRVTSHPLLPDWWTERGNIILSPPDFVGAPLPNISTHPGLEPPENCCLIVNGKNDYSIMLWGARSLFFISPTANLNGSVVELGCGSIYVGPQVRVTARLKLNCRNGGSIYLERDLLIASDVQMLTDDCHSIIDLTSGERINKFGGNIHVSEHVWIGQETLIFGDTEIGPNTVIGARSMLRHRFLEGNIVLAGSPPRVLRVGVTWDHRDDMRGLV